MLLNGLIACLSSRGFSCYRRIFHSFSKTILISTRGLRKSQGPKHEKQNNEGITTIAIYVAAAFSLLLFTTKRYVYCVSVIGRSMQPTINPEDSAMFNDWVLLDRRPMRDHTVIQRGDVVTYMTPRDPNEINIKRVVGLEGDTVTTLGYKNRFVKIPTGHCWVEGDNQALSDDSNKVGPIPLGLITGRASYIVFPVTRWQHLGPRFPHSRVKINPNFDDTSVRCLPDVNSPYLYRHQRNRPLAIAMVKTIARERSLSTKQRGNGTFGKKY